MSYVVFLVFEVRVPYRRKRLAFGISSPDEFLLALELTQTFTWLSFDFV